MKPRWKLYDERWRALWPARHEVPDADVEVLGVMIADYGAPSSGRTRGRITAVRLVTAALTPAPGTELGRSARAAAGNA